MNIVTGASLSQIIAPNFRAVLVAIIGVTLFIGQGSPSLALALGLGSALTLGNPWPSLTRLLSQRALAISVVGLGAGMNLIVVGRLGVHGLGITVGSIALALLFGRLLGRYLRVPNDTAMLISVGTAICGGSAIAAVAPTIRAKDEEISVALAAVFLLNSVALLIFPAIGHALHLNQDSFGTWAALAIHDTSCVVGAAAQYGPRALEVATATKLARALWIVPLTFGIALFRSGTRENSGETRAKQSFPWFIAGFVFVAALVTYVPALRTTGLWVSGIAHRLLTVTLFLVGLGLTRNVVRSVGVRPFVQGVTVWVVLGAVTLVYIVTRGH